MIVCRSASKKKRWVEKIYLNEYHLTKPDLLSENRLEAAGMLLCLCHVAWKLQSLRLYDLQTLSKHSDRGVDRPTRTSST